MALASAIKPPFVRSVTASSNGTNADTVNYTYPSTIVAGDLLICFTYAHSSTGSAPSSSGWTTYAALSGSSVNDYKTRGGVLWKIAAGTESGSFSVTQTRGTENSLSNGFCFAIGGSAAFAGCVLADWDDSEARNTSSAESILMSVNDQTTTQDNILIVGSVCNDYSNASFTDTSMNGFTRLDTIATGSGSWGISGVCYSQVATASGTYTKAIWTKSDTGEANIGWQFGVIGSPRTRIFTT